MAAPEIEISKDGLKLSYQRYLTDSASGFVFIIGIIFAVSKNYPLPFIGHSIEPFLGVSDNAKIFIFFLLFLLANPIGLLIHQLSWFLFGWFEIYPVKYFLDGKKLYSYMLNATKKIFFYEQACMIQEENNCDVKYKIYKEYLIMFFPEHSVEHIVGLMFFIRSLACLSFLALLSVLHVMFWDDSVSCSVRIPFVLFSATVFFSILYSFVERFRCLKTFSTIYLLCVAKGIPTGEKNSPQDLIKKIHAAYFGEKSGGEN